MTANIYLDFETTGLPFLSSFEIITGFFKCGEDELEIKCFPYHWNESAASVHNLRYNEVMQYPRMDEVFPLINSWLARYPKAHVWCYAKPYHGILFDQAALQITYATYARIQDLDNMRLKWNSVYFDVKPLGLPNSSQPAVYKYLFNEDYRAHQAKDDVLAMIKIHERIKKGAYVYRS